MVRKSQSAMEESADVAAWRESVEKRTEIASHTEMYTPLRIRKSTRRTHSSATGFVPLRSSPNPDRTPPSEKTVRKTTVAPARNFALMMVSR